MRSFVLHLIEFLLCGYFSSFFLLLLQKIIVTIRYGRQSDEVMGLQFVKELCLISETIYPEKANKKPMSPLQVC